MTNHLIPDYILRVNGENIAPKMNARLISLTLTDSRGFEADQLDISLSDHDGALALPPRGATITLALGWRDQGLMDKGDYIVDEVEHSGAPDIITIRARSADLRSTFLEQKERSFHLKTVAEIVNQIAAEHGLKAMVSAAFAHEEIVHIDQQNESDANLLQRLATHFDAIATVKKGCLLFMEAGKGESASGLGIGNVLIERKSGDSHRFSIAENDNYKAVRAYYHDKKTGKRIEVMTQGKQSGSISSQSENIKTLRHTYRTKYEAQKAVQKEMERLKRGAATFELTLAIGNAELSPEMGVQVSGFKTDIDSTKWIITQATHTLDSSGFTSQIQCELKG